MANSGSIRAGKAYVEASLDDSKLSAGLKAASAKLKAWGAGIRNIGLGVSAMAAAVTAPLAEFAREAANSGAELYNASKRTGFTVEALSELKYAAQQTGSDLEGLENGLRKMSKFVVAAAEGTDTAVESLEHLGLAVEQLTNLSPEQRFALIGDRISQIKDPTLQAALAMEVFGKTGTMLLPMLDGGAAGLEKWRLRARSLGLTTSTESAVASKDFRLVLNDLESTLGKLGRTVGQAVIPILKRKFELITGLVVKGIAWAKANRELIATVFRVASVVGIAGAVLIGLGTTVSILGKAMLPLASMVTAFGAAIGFIVSPIGILVAGLVGLGAYFAYTTDAGAVATTYLSAAFKTLAGDVGIAISGITNAIKSGDWPLAAEIAGTTLKIVWQRGVNELAGIWNAFGPTTIKFFSDTWTVLLSVTEVVWDAMRSGWTNTLKFFSESWASVVWGMKRAWLEAKEFISGTGAVGVKGAQRLLNPSGAAPGLEDALGQQALDTSHEQHVADEKAAIDKEANDAVKAAGDKANAEREAQAKRHADRMAQIAADGQARGQAALQGTSVDEKALDDKLKQLTDQQKAEAQRAAKEAAAVKKPGLPDIPKLPNADDIADGLNDLGKRTVASSGTFSAVAASLIGRKDDFGAKIAKNTEAASKLLADINAAMARVMNWA